ncbi:hypothetical protein AT01_2867 [Yersinia aldovae 670-83]|nr:hypothetical protein AT01_2867 [Yersinia aldovae 670-83]
MLNLVSVYSTPTCSKATYPAYRYSWLAICISTQVTLGAMFYPIFVNAEDYFNPASLEMRGRADKLTDLSQFSQVGGQSPGTYWVDIYLGDRRISSQKVNFVDINGKLQPELTPRQLGDIGVKIDAFPALKALPPDTPLTDLGLYIPQASSRLDFNQQRLNLSIPQAALDNRARGYVSPELWDSGLTALLMDYNFSGSNTLSNNQSAANNSYYLNLRSGLNMGAWRLRNYSAYSDSSSGGQNWDSINTYAQRDIQSLRGQLVLGETASPGDIFDSVQFLGAQLLSDDNMLPDSLRGFAPVIRGIAQSNAQITIRQNNSIIYQSYVAPGAFEITDLYPTAASGNLDVTIREADGSERSFTQPFSSVPIMLREGQMKYAATAGQYRSSNNNSQTPNFGQATLIYGLPYATTVYGGSLIAENYTAIAVGLGYGFNDWGSISLDGIQANTELPDTTTHSGQSYRFRYSKDIAVTSTSFSLAGYRYSTEGYYDFQEVNEWSNVDTTNGMSNYNKRSKIQANISQSMGDFGSLNFSGYQQDYWRKEGYERSIMAGYNLSYKSINYSFSYSYTQNPGSDIAANQQFAFGVHIPLSRWLPNSWATYSINTTKGGSTAQQAGLSGTALADNNLSYGISQGYSNRGGGSSGNANLSYKGTYGEVRTGYNYSNDSHQLNYGLNGGIAAHPYGVTFSQQFGDTAALVRAPGAKGLRVENNTGVYTDWRGYTVVSSVSTYRNNRIALDTQSMADDVDIDLAVQNVVPTQGALVLADFKTRVGSRVLINLQYRNKPVPFGAIVTQSDVAATAQPNTSIVGDEGQVYMSGIPDNVHLEVKWGDDTSQRCQVSFTLPEVINSPSIRHIDAICQ